MPAHLAILRPFYLNLILSGQKTIECRLTRTARPPFRVVKKGQRIYLKQSSGPVRALATAGKIICRRITTPKDLKAIRQKYNQWIIAKDDFWESRNAAGYCTLIFLEDVQPLAQPFRISKNDMRAWVVLDGTEGFDFPAPKN